METTDLDWTVGVAGLERKRAALVADLMNALQWGVEALAQGYRGDGRSALNEVCHKLATNAKGLFVETTRTEMLRHAERAVSLLSHSQSNSVSQVNHLWMLLTREAAVGMNPFAALNEEGVRASLTAKGDV